jgi:hypothetical protein
MALNQTNLIDEDVDVNFPYRECVGSIMYAAVASRPDLACAVNHCARHISSPTKADVLAVKRILRYLKDTTQFGIRFKADQDPALQAFVDADWAGDLMDRKSTSGNVIFFGGPISWTSRKQSCVALSSTEAEYISISELSHCRQILIEIGVKVPLTTVYEDNQSAITIATSENTRRSKHIDVRHHYIKDLINRGVFALQYIPSIVADIMTKALGHGPFVKLRAVLVAPLKIEKGVEARDPSNALSVTPTVALDSDTVI